jgi:hypothetical protein
MHNKTSCAKISPSDLKAACTVASIRTAACHEEVMPGVHQYMIEHSVAASFLTKLMNDKITDA